MDIQLVRIAATTRGKPDGYLVARSVKAFQNFVRDNNLASYKPETATADVIKVAEGGPLDSQLKRIARFRWDYVHVKSRNSGDFERWMFTEANCAPVVERVTFDLPVREKPNTLVTGASQERAAAANMAEIRAMPGPG